MEAAAPPQTVPIFPHDITLEDARAAIAGRFEFKEKQEGDLIFIDYRFSSSHTFPSPETASDAHTAHLLRVRRECRGIVFSAQTGKVVARRYHKFFNVGELPETQEDRIDLKQPHVILTKYDGSLVSPIRTKEGIRFATKGGITDVSLILEQRFLVDANARFKDFAAHWLDKDHTAIFEWCSPRTRIVLDYQKDLLILTAIRHNVTGHYLPYADMAKSAGEFGIPVTEAIPNPHGSDIGAFYSTMKKLEGVEGFVIRFEDGRMYKVKTEWYFARNKKDKQDFSFNSECNIWKYVIDEQVDDALGFTTDQRLKERIRDFQALFWEKLNQEANKLTDVYNGLKARSPEKKDFVQNVTQAGLHPAEGAILFQVYDGRELHETLLQQVRKACNNLKNLDNVRPLLGGVKFTE